MQGYSASSRSGVRGFTLTELAIVLGVAGVIVGAIWAAASTAREHKRDFQANQQIMTVVQNIREYYMNAQGIPNCTAEGTDFTDTLAGYGVFPNEMRSTSTTCANSICINSPYVNAIGPTSGIKTGSFRVLGSSCAGTASRFQVVLTNLTPAACSRLLQSGANYKDQSIGTTRVCAASEGSSAFPCYSQVTTKWLTIACSGNVCGPCTSFLANGACSTVPTPITLAQAQAYCDSASSSEVAWEFTLRK